MTKFSKLTTKTTKIFQDWGVGHPPIPRSGHPWHYRKELYLSPIFSWLKKLCIAFLLGGFTPPPPPPIGTPLSTPKPNLDQKQYYRYQNRYFEPKYIEINTSKPKVLIFVRAYINDGIIFIPSFIKLFPENWGSE